MKIENYNEYYIQGSDHYLIPKDVFKELFNEMINWKEESKKQKEINQKAIEYIKWQYENPTYDNVWRKWEVEELLSILEDKEVSE